MQVVVLLYMVHLWSLFCIDTYMYAKVVSRLCLLCSVLLLATLVFSLYTSVIKIENFKRRIGIAGKSHKTRRDHWGGNVNHKSLL